MSTLENTALTSFLRNGCPRKVPDTEENVPPSVGVLISLTHMRPIKLSILETHALKTEMAYGVVWSHWERCFRYLCFAVLEPGALLSIGPTDIGDPWGTNKCQCQGDPRDTERRVGHGGRMSTDTYATSSLCPVVLHQTVASFSS